MAHHVGFSYSLMQGHPLPYGFINEREKKTEIQRLLSTVHLLGTSDKVINVFK